MGAENTDDSQLACETASMPTTVPVAPVTAGSGTLSASLEDRVYMLHIENIVSSEAPHGDASPKRNLVFSFTEHEVGNDASEPSSALSPPRTPQLRTPLRTPLTPATNQTGATNFLPEAEATLAIDELMQDSFLLDLPEEKIKSRIEKVQKELANEPQVPIEVCDKTQALEDLLEREFKNHESAFYLVDLGTVVRKYEQWITLLPNVKPFYAIKSNPNPAIVRTCKALGCGFDCASQAELEMVLGIGARPEDVIFANPCKMNAHILYAKQHGVTKMTFDNVAELQKIHNLYPEAELILRLLPPDASSAVCNFGSKFGANKKMVKSLLKEAKKLNANFVGVSFHVGSGCWDAKAYTLALEMAHQVCVSAKEEYGFNIKYLDIGGGYPAADNSDSITFPKICETLHEAFDRWFPPSSGIEIIAEPGRYMCGEAVVLAVNIIAKRTKVPAESTVLNDDDDDDSEDDDEEDITAETAAEGKVCEPTVPTKKKKGKAKNKGGDGGGDAADDDEEEEEEEQVLYYLSDGVYGSFNNIMYDHQHPMPQISGHAAKNGNDAPAASRKSTLFGPTCDSIDVICRDVRLPDLDIGSWLYFLNMGAYTMAAASSFNGFAPPPCKFIITPGSS